VRHGGQYEARQTERDERRSPAVKFIQPAAGKVAYDEAERAAHHVATQSLGPLSSPEVVADQRLGGRSAPCFANRHTDSDEQ
jgi:hypothetical protein